MVVVGWEKFPRLFIQVTLHSSWKLHHVRTWLAYHCSLARSLACLHVETSSYVTSGGQVPSGATVLAGPTSCLAARSTQSTHVVPAEIMGLHVVCLAGNVCDLAFGTSLVEEMLYVEVSLVSCISGQLDKLRAIVDGAHRTCCLTKLVAWNGLGEGRRGVSKSSMQEPADLGPAFSRAAHACSSCRYKRHLKYFEVC